MTEEGKALLFALFLVLMTGTFVSMSFMHSDPIVLGTECRTAGHNGDHLYFGAIDCSSLF